MIKKANYKSPEFYKILTTVNEVLSYYDLPTISEERGSITESIYNVGKYGSLLMWRTTNYDCPQLMTDGIMDKIYWQLKQVFPQYVADKTITVANPKYSTNKHGKPIASIVIMITELLDNILTKEEFAALKTKDPAVLANCFEKEARMFRRDGDMRDQLTRLEDFAFSMVYEPKLVATPLFKISNLTLLHQTDVVTLEADYSPDFYGTIEDAVYKIEGKSTKAFVDYSAMNTAGFAEYIDSRVKSGSLGGLHGADYCLLVLKATGDVICFETADYQNNWKAGKIDLEDYQPL